MAQELLTTFNDDNLSAVTLVPNRTPAAPGAKFTISYHQDKQETTVLWDREEQQGFPDVKELKQIVRDRTNPDLYLGHSDNQKHEKGAQLTTVKEYELNPPPSAAVWETVTDQVVGPNVAIRYCTGCRWLLRSAYFATELVETFAEEIGSVTLIPSRPPEDGGIFVRRFCLLSA